MKAPDLVVRGRRVVTGGGLVAVAVHVRDGVIETVTGYDQVPAGCEVMEAEEAVVMPGLVTPTCT